MHFLTLQSHLEAAKGNCWSQQQQEEEEEREKYCKSQRSLLLSESLPLLLHLHSTISRVLWH